MSNSKTASDPSIRAIRVVESSCSTVKSGHTSIAGEREVPCAVLGESVRGPEPAYDGCRQVVVRSRAGKAARLRTDVLSSDLVPDMVVEVQHRKGMSMRNGNAGTGRVKSAIGLVGASTAAILVFLGAGPAVAQKTRPGPGLRPPRRPCRRAGHDRHHGRARGGRDACGRRRPTGDEPRHRRERGGHGHRQRHQQGQLGRQLVGHCFLGHQRRSRQHHGHRGRGRHRRQRRLECWNRHRRRSRLGCHQLRQRRCRRQRHRDGGAQRHVRQHRTFQRAVECHQHR